MAARGDKRPGDLPPITGGKGDDGNTAQLQIFECFIGDCARDYVAKLMVKHYLCFLRQVRGEGNLALDRELAAAALHNEQCLRRLKYRRNPAACRVDGDSEFHPYPFHLFDDITAKGVPSQKNDVLSSFEEYYRGDNATLFVDFRGFFAPLATVGGKRVKPEALEFTVKRGMVDPEEYGRLTAVAIAGF